MWNPGFPHVERRPAELRGYHRAFCVVSYHYRGSPDRPGLVLGLDRGGRCSGIAYRVTAADWPGVIAYLDDRELIGYPYRRVILPLDIGSHIVDCCTYVADPAHPDYAGGLTADEIARRITTASGTAGGNRDYLHETVRQMEAHGYDDAGLRDLARRVNRLAATTAPVP